MRAAQKAIRAGAPDVAEEALARAGELELRVTRPMLRRLVVRASDARDLDTTVMCAHALPLLQTM